MRRVRTFSHLLRRVQRRPALRRALALRLIPPDLVMLPWRLERVRSLREAFREAWEGLEWSLEGLDRRSPHLVEEEWPLDLSLERRVQERGVPDFWELRGFRPLDLEELEDRLEEAERAGRIGRRERGEVLRADALWRGWGETGEEVLVVVEVAEEVRVEEVEAVDRRGRALERALGVQVEKVVAGRYLYPEARRRARVLGVRTVRLAWE